MFLSPWYYYLCDSLVYRSGSSGVGSTGAEQRSPVEQTHNSSSLRGAKQGLECWLRQSNLAVFPGSEIQTITHNIFSKKTQYSYSPSKGSEGMSHLKAILPTPPQYHLWHYICTSMKHMYPKIRLHLLLLLAMACTAWFSSCDVFAYNSYYIQNNTDVAIDVAVYRKVHSQVNDTFFRIAKDDVTKIHLVGDRIHKEYKKKPHDIIIEFDSVVVTKNGARSKKNYLSNDTWSFTPKEGKYTAEVNNDEF